MYNRNPYGNNNPNGAFVAPSNTQAKLEMPTMGEMGGRGQVPWVRFPFFSDFALCIDQSECIITSSLLRSYLAETVDSDYTAGSESIRTVQFDIPCRIIAINAAAVDPVTVSTNAAPTINLLNCFFVPT